MCGRRPSWAGWPRVPGLVSLQGTEGDTRPREGPREDGGRGRSDAAAGPGPAEPPGPGRGGRDPALEPGRERGPATPGGQTPASGAVRAEVAVVRAPCVGLVGQPQARRPSCRLGAGGDCLLTAPGTAGQPAILAPPAPRPPPRVCSKSLSRTPGEQVRLWGVAASISVCREGAGGGAMGRGCRVTLRRVGRGCAGRRGARPVQPPPAASRCRPLAGRPHSMGVPGAETGRAPHRPSCPRPPSRGGRWILLTGSPERRE